MGHSGSSKSLLTPKELADAIGASESSLRRWVDGGRIAMSRTAGGHRRIPLAEAVRFIRESGATVVRPEVLGLGLGLGLGVSASHGTAPPAKADEDVLFEALRAGERRTAVGLIVSWYLTGRSLPALFDGPVKTAMHRVGELWRHNGRGILVEHRATEICLDVVSALRRLLPAPGERAPLAVGGAPEADPYLLPTGMAGAVLAEAGFRDVNFGPNTPLELLGREAIDQGARLVWVSISTAGEPKALRRALRGLAEVLQPRHVRLVVGGRACRAVLTRGQVGVTVAESMTELAALAADPPPGQAAAPARGRQARGSAGQKA
jgi:MerR family transcriptional regulator, light-induced transcriptional regulator